MCGVVSLIPWVVAMVTILTSSSPGSRQNSTNYFIGWLHEALQEHSRSQPCDLSEIHAGQLDGRVWEVVSHNQSCLPDWLTRATSKWEQHSWDRNSVFSPFLHWQSAWPAPIWPCSSVGIAAVICSRGRGFEHHQGQRFFLFFHVSPFPF